MSSKILTTEEHSDVVPVPWRRVLPAGAASTAVNQPPVDDSRRIAELEQQSE